VEDNINMAKDKRKPVYTISIAAGLADVHPQTLRLYERRKLVKPTRTSTNIRLYSEEDVEQILYIQELTQDCGINLAGVKRVLNLERELELTKISLQKVKREMDELTEEMEKEIENVRRSFKHEIIPISSQEIEPI
jgi:MerR family transcriptional regulator/heat shock protein HspR